MKSIQEIRTRLDDIFEDVCDCMTMPCSMSEQIEDESILEDIRKLSRINDNELIQVIELEAKMQYKYGHCNGLDYVSLLIWINKN